MRTQFLKSVIVSLILLLSINAAFTQTKEDLQKEKKKTEEELKLTNELLEQTEKSKTVGLNRLLIIQKRISLREKLINEITIEVNLIDKEIEKNNSNIKRLEAELKQLKEEYAKMIYFAYKNRNNYDRLMFVLAAEDFNQAYRRMKYFQQYTKYRQKQAEKIVIAQKNIEYETEQLSEKRNSKIRLLSNKERERANLSAEKFKKNTEIKRLKQKEKELRKKIQEKQRAMEKIKNAIAELIAREAKENKTFKTLTASEELISQGFKNARGKLKWPIDNGIVIRGFGPYTPEGLKGVKMHNDGIDISSAKDAKVKAIYEGEIKRVIAVPGANMAVIIRHGHYLTLYSNIVNVRVKPGDKIYEGHYIGDVYVDQEEKSATLHLGIYEETQVLNPKNWLRRM